MDIDLLKIMDSPIAYQRCLVPLTESVLGALLLSQSIFFQRRCKSEDGWWSKTQEEWEDSTGMTRRELETARKNCSKFLRHELRGVPATSFYKIDVEALFSSLALSAKLVCSFPPNKLGAFRQTTIEESTEERVQERSSKTNSNLKEVQETLLKKWREKGFPKVLQWTDKRQRLLSARSKEPEFMQNWEKALDRFAASDFVMNQWKPVIDCFLRAGMWAEILEGKYDNRKIVPFQKPAPREIECGEGNF